MTCIPYVFLAWYRCLGEDYKVFFIILYYSSVL